MRLQNSGKLKSHVTQTPILKLRDARKDGTFFRFTLFAVCTRGRDVLDAQKSADHDHLRPGTCMSLSIRVTDDFPSTARIKVTVGGFNPH